jgi:hypothetical protein
MEFDPAGNPQARVELVPAGTVREPFPVTFNAVVPRLNRPSKLAVTVPDGTDPPELAGAATMLNVTGSAKVGCMAIDVTVRLTVPLPVPPTLGETLLL